MTPQPPAHWKQLYSGRAFDVLNPAPEAISIVDIAHALALTNRYGGHTPSPYSVAQHSVLVSDELRKTSEELARFGLLHDAAEAYLGDVCRPVKHLPEMAAYRDAEARLQAVIYRRFGLGLPPDPVLLKFADSCMLLTEAEVFFPRESRPFDWDVCGFVLTVDVTPWDWRAARERFLGRFAGLFPEQWREANREAA